MGNKREPKATVLANDSSSPFSLACRSTCESPLYGIATLAMFEGALLFPSASTLSTM